MIQHILITGMSGTGKSTLFTELKNRGLSAIDLDEHEDLCWMYFKESGKLVETEFENHNLEWVQSVEWLWDKAKLQELINKQLETTYYCGSADNIEKMTALFNVIFVLQVNDEIVRARLSTRTNNNWAQTTEVQDWLLAQTHGYVKVLMSNGAIALDANQPTHMIADIVTKTLNSNSTLEATKLSL
jgi:dephospho-CoA kinase